MQSNPEQSGRRRVHRLRLPRRRHAQQRRNHFRHADSLGQRKGVTTPQLVGDFFMKTGHIKEGVALAFAPPAIFGLGAAGGAEFYIRNRGEGGPQALAGNGGVLGRLQQDPMFVQVNSLWKPNVPQLFVEVDREKAKALGVSVDEIFNTMSATLGSYYVNDFNKYGRTWQVL